jgi:hypothetical protein
VVRARFILVCALIVGSGCSLIYSSDLDDARTSSAVADSGDLRESGTSTTSSSSGEAGVVDAGPDAPTRGCSSYSPAPKFCDDFDQGTDVGAKWGNVNQQGGSIAYDSSQFWSGTRSAKVALHTPKSCQYNRLEQTFYKGKDRFEVRFMMRPAKPWNDFTPFVINIGKNNNGPECQPLFDTHVDKTTGMIVNTEVDVQTGAGATNDQRDLAGVPPTDDWSEVVFVAQTNGGNGLDLSYTSGGKTDTMTFAQCPSSWDFFAVNMGFHCDSGNGTIDYDDIRVDWDGP